MLLKKHICDAELAASSYGKWVVCDSIGLTLCSIKVRRDIGKDSRKKAQKSYNYDWTIDGFKSRTPVDPKFREKK